jgi:hypothetical protein
MARHIDLTSKLSNERPTIQIGEKVYEVNDEKSNILSMNSMLNNFEGDEIEMVDAIIEKLVGKKAFKEINALKLSILDYKTIAFALIACVGDEEIEEVEERFQKSNQG